MADLESRHSAWSWDGQGFGRSRGGGWGSFEAVEEKREKSCGADVLGVAERKGSRGRGEGEGGGGGTEEEEPSLGRGWTKRRAGSSTGRTAVESKMSKGPPTTSRPLPLSRRKPSIKASSPPSAPWLDSDASVHFAPPTVRRALFSSRAHADATPVLTARMRSGRSTMERRDVESAVRMYLCLTHASWKMTAVRFEATAGEEDGDARGTGLGVDAVLWLGGGGERLLRASEYDEDESRSADESRSRAITRKRKEGERGDRAHASRRGLAPARCALCPPSRPCCALREESEGSRVSPLLPLSSAVVLADCAPVTFSVAA